MCIMIYVPSGAVFPLENVPELFSGNRDGLGIFWANSGKLHVSRSLPKNAKECIASLKAALEKANGAPLIAHFRYATHGTISLANVHPFEIRKDLILAHNGVLSIDTATGETDTQAFIARYLKPVLARSRNPIAALSGPLGGLVGEAIIGSKFAVMDSRGKVALVNERDGEWRDGVWYSNLSWERRAPYYVERNPRKFGIKGYGREKETIGVDDWAYF